MIEIRRVHDFPRGTLYRQLTDAYAFDERYRRNWDDLWLAHDDFFYSNPSIADRYAFITAVNGKAVGHISWDPRNRPDHVGIGHNCISPAFRGRGYGRLQLREAVRRIREYPDLRRILVTTNALLIPAQRNYESAGFVKVAERTNAETPFAGNYIDYDTNLNLKVYKHASGFFVIPRRRPAGLLAASQGTSTQVWRKRCRRIV